MNHGRAIRRASNGTRPVLPGAPRNLIERCTVQRQIPPAPLGVRNAVAKASEAIGEPESATTDWTRAQRHHGVVAPDEESARALACIHGVVLPIAQALLASGADRVLT